VIATIFIIHGGEKMPEIHDKDEDGQLAQVIYAGDFYSGRNGWIS
jgi:hypothetical protein